MHGRVDIAVAYMGPNVTPCLTKYSSKFDVLISVDFAIPELKPVRVVDVCNGIPPVGIKYPHRLFIYEFNRG